MLEVKWSRIRRLLVSRMRLGALLLAWCARGRTLAVARWVTISLGVQGH